MTNLLFSHPSNLLYICSLEVEAECYDGYVAVGSRREDTALNVVLWVVIVYSVECLIACHMTTAILIGEVDVYEARELDAKTCCDEALTCWELVCGNHILVALT